MIPSGGPELPAAGMRVLERRAEGRTHIISWTQALAQRHGPQSHTEPRHDKYCTRKLPLGGGEIPKAPFVLKH